VRSHEVSPPNNTVALLQIWNLKTSCSRTRPMKLQWKLLTLVSAGGLQTVIRMAWKVELELSIMWHQKCFVSLDFCDDWWFVDTIHGLLKLCFSIASLSSGPVLYPRLVTMIAVHVAQALLFHATTLVPDGKSFALSFYVSVWYLVNRGRDVCSISWIPSVQCRQWKTDLWSCDRRETRFS